MRVEKKSMNWFQKPSAYEHQQRISKWQKNRAQLYLRQNESLASAFLTAQQNKSVLQTEQVVKSAVDRIHAEAKKRVDSNLDQFDKTLANLSKLA